MKLFHYFYTIAFFLFVTQLTYAYSSHASSIDTKSMDNAYLWVVSPGTRLVAGNKNEFYIISKDELSTHSTGAKRIKTRIASKKDVARIKMAINDILHRATPLKHRIVPSAQINQKHGFATHRPPAKMRLAMAAPQKQTPTKLKLATIKRRARGIVLTDNHR